MFNAQADAADQEASTLDEQAVHLDRTAEEAQRRANALEMNSKEALEDAHCSAHWKGVVEVDV